MPPEVLDIVDMREDGFGCGSDINRFADGDHGWDERAPARRMAIPPTRGTNAGVTAAYRVYASPNLARTSPSSRRTNRTYAHTSRRTLNIAGETVTRFL